MTLDYARHGGTAWPVQPGDLWAVGEHRLLCGDLEVGAADRLRALTGQPVALLYTDPPWGRGIHRQFRNKAGVPGEPDHDALMAAIIGLAAQAESALIEMSNRDLDAFLHYTTAARLPLTAKWKITWDRGKKPCVLLAFQHRFGMPDFTGLDDAQTPEVAVEHLTSPGELVIDPCTGLGYTAAACAKLNRPFLGSELHPNRVSATLERLRKMGAGTPERIA